MAKKLEEKSILYLLVVLTIAVFLCFGIFYFIFELLPEIRKPKEIKPEGKPMEEVIRDLSVPEGELGPEELPREVIENLTVPESKKETFSLPEDVIKKLSVPQGK